MVNKYQSGPSHPKASGNGPFHQTIPPQIQDGSLQSYRQYVQGLPLSEPPEEGQPPVTTRH
jgi:hypothetical protein